MTEEEKFFAWLDGELDSAEAAAMAAKVAADPALSQAAGQHRVLGAQLKSAFDPIARAPLPERLQSALPRDAEVIDFAEARRARRIPALPQWAAMAATLAVGVIAGTMVPHRPNAPVAVEGGSLYAAGAVDQALNVGLASAPAGDVRIGTTFRNQQGTVCRSFTTAAASGLACRDDGRWRLKGMFAAPEGQAGDYRMAAGMDPNLAALVDSLIAGEPLDAAQERAARANDWR